jgi:outer membrane protein insertion porin family
VALVRIQGNRRIEDDAIRAVIRTQAGASVTQDLLREDVRAIWGLGLFEDVRVELETTPRGVVVVFVVRERPVIRRIFVAGNRAVSLADINKVLQVRREQVFDRARLQADARRILDLYRERGFFLTDVSFAESRVDPVTVDVTFRIRESDRIAVRRVNLVGTRVASDAELRDILFTQAPNLLSPITGTGRFREELLERDILLLQAYYHDRGHLDVKIEAPRVELAPDRRSVTITIAIEEGPRYSLGVITFAGDLFRPEGELRRVLSVSRGQVFNRSAVARDLERLTGLYKDQGYAFAQVVPVSEIDRERLTVDLSLEVSRGPRVFIERIELRGNTRTRDKVIRRELRIAEGEAYNQSRIDLSKRRVTALGFFEHAEILTQRGSADDQMVLVVEVKERSTGTFQIGAGLSSVETFILQGQIAQQNLFGRGQSLSLQLMLSRLRRLFQLQFEAPYFLDTRWTFGVSAYNQQRADASFLRTSLGGSLTWGYMLLDDLRLFLTYTLEQVGVSLERRGPGPLAIGPQRPLAVPTGALGDLLRSGLTSAPQLSLVYDSRDNRLLTTRGMYHTASVEIADDPYTLSQNTFVRTMAALRFFRPVWRSLVLRVRVEGGLVQSRDPRGVPLFERFFMGGIFDVRGFPPRSLGPRIAVAEARVAGEAGELIIGGNAKVLGTLELEAPIVRAVGLRGVVFFDAGNAFNLDDQFCQLRPAGVPTERDPCIALWPLEALRTSVGFGFRWFSPIGPLRFEWGIPLRALPGEEPIVFEFTIGTAF